MNRSTPSKRLRAGELGLITPSSAKPSTPELPASGEPRPDVFDAISQWSSRSKGFEKRLRELELDCLHWRSRAEDSERQVSRLEGELAREKALAAELAEERRQREAALESRLQREAARAAEASAEADAARREAQSARLALRGAPQADEGAQQDGAEQGAAQPSTSGALAEARAREADLRAESVELQARQAAREHSTRLQAELERCAQLEARAGAAEARAGLAEAKARALEEAGALSSAGASPSAPACALRARVLELEELLAARALGGSPESPSPADSAREAALERARRAEALQEGAERAAAEAEARAAAEGRWAAVLEGAGGCATPEEVLTMLRRLRDEAEEARAAAEAAGEAAAAARARAAAEEGRAEVAEARAREAEAGAFEVRRELEVWRRRAEGGERERAGLQAALESYDREWEERGGGGHLARVAELEAARKLAEEAAREAEAGAAAARREAGAGAEGAREAAEAEARRWRERCAALEAEAERGAVREEALAARVARGEFDPASTRVVHLRLNPEVEARREESEARVEELQAEVGALREALAGGGIRGRGGPAEDDSCPGPAFESARERGQQVDSCSEKVLAMRLRQVTLESENGALRARALAAHKGADRLRSAFARHSALFRQVVYLVFGFRVDMAVEGGGGSRAEVRLKPHLAADAADELRFRVEGAGVELLPTPYSERELRLEQEMFLKKFGSVPAFTANLTMELFQRQTRA